MSDNKKKGHPIRNTTIGVGLLAVLAFLFGPKLGLGAGGVIPAFQTQTAPQAQTQTQPEQTAAPAEKPNGNRIVIENDVIYYMGSPVTTDELREQIVKSAKEGAIILENKQAIKGAYDAVTSLLTELGLQYSEVTQ